jgi:septal ring factor EnvC (AmiA/AmiB activator)
MTKKSPDEDPVMLRKRIRRLTDSRDQWKGVHKKGQIERKRLREKVGDEIERRDKWKTSFKQKEDAEKCLMKRVEDLEKQIEVKEHENANLKRELEEIKKKQRK